MSSKIFNRWWIVFIAYCLLPSSVQAKPTDGILLENASMLGRGGWEVKFSPRLGAGAEPIEGPFLTATASDPIEVDQIVIPVEMRYGWSDQSEYGWFAAFESDDGKTIPAGSNVPGTFLDGGGLQKLQFFGKWKIRPRWSWMVDAGFLGDNALVGGSDGFDFGVKLLSNPRLGRGHLLMNLGLDIKGGGGDFNDNGVTASAEEYENPITFGLGYVYPFTGKLEGIFELAGSTSPFAGGAGFKGNHLATVLMGLRYGWADRFFLSGGLGGGVLTGSPNFSVHIGLNWLFGSIRRYERSGEDSDFWAPSEDMQREVERKMAPAPARDLEDELAERTAEAVETFNRGDYVAAAALYQAIINLKNDDALLHYNLATTYFLMKRYPAAKTSYINATRLNPNDVDTHLYLGYTYYYLNSLPQARREWQKVLELDPANELARNNLNSLEVP